jgi:hypothetical protein
MIVLLCVRSYSKLLFSSSQRMPSGPETKCSPLCLTDLIRFLPPAARTKIEEIGHGKLLQF